MRTSNQNKNIIKLIKALLSGDYVQGADQLYNTNTRCHCVLGVALETQGFHKFGEYYSFGFDADDITELFSKRSVPRNWFNRTFGVFPGYLSHRNDNGWTFAELAAHLVGFLPKTPEKLELQVQIVEALQAEGKYRESLGLEVIC